MEHTAAAATGLAGTGPTSGQGAAGQGMMHRGAYKGGTDGARMGRGRRERAATLRRDKREAALLARRRIAVPGEDSEAVFDPAHFAAIDTAVKAWDPKHPEACAALAALRSVLALTSPPIRLVEESPGLLEHVMRVLTESPVPQNTLFALWCLTNFAAHASVHACARLVSLGPFLTPLTSGQDCLLAEQACMLIGNLSGVSDDLRDTLVANGAATALVKVLQQPGAPAALITAAAFACWNIAGGASPPLSELFSAGIDAAVVQAARRDWGVDATLVLSELGWLLSHLTGREANYSTQLVHAGFPDVLMQLLAQPFEVAWPTLRACGNMIASSDSLAERLMEVPGFLAAIERMLHAPHHGTVREAAWTLANLTGAEEMGATRDALVEQPGLLPTLRSLLMNERGAPVRREAAYALAHLALDKKHVRAIFELDTLPGFVAVMTSERDPPLLRLMIDVCGSILSNVNEAEHAFEQVGGISALEALQYGTTAAEDEDVRRGACILVDRFFGDIDDFETLGAASTDADLDQRYADLPPWRRGPA